MNLTTYKCRREHVCEECEEFRVWPDRLIYGKHFVVQITITLRTGKVKAEMLVVVPTARPPKNFFSVTASRIFPTLNVTAHLKTLFCYRKKFIAHPATTLNTTRR